MRHLRSEHCLHSATGLKIGPKWVYVCCGDDGNDGGPGSCGAVVVHPGVCYEESAHGLVGITRDRMAAAVEKAREALCNKEE